MKNKGILTFPMYKPKKGKEKELLKILKNHIPTLRKLELITDDPAYSIKSEDGTIIEIFVWTGEKAIETAHKHPAIRAMWGKMMDICTFPGMKDLAESNKSFPNFKVLKRGF